MARPLRTFVAFRCGPSVQRRLRRESERLAALDDALHPPRAEEYHLTVQFLGDTDERDLGVLGKAVNDAAASIDPIDVVYGGLGAFPTPERARVVWSGVREEEDPGALARMAAVVGERLGDAGYPPEARAFHPHVTLGRLRRRPGSDLVEAVQAGADAIVGAEILSELKLILSQPGERGYHYIDLTSALLGSDEG